MLNGLWQTELVSFSQWDLCAKLRQYQQLTDVVFLDLADVTVQRTVSKQNQHDGTVPLLDRGHNVGRVSHHSVLILSPWIQEDPSLVPNVEDPQLAGNVSCGVDLSSVHVDLPLE